MTTSQAICGFIATVSKATKMVLQLESPPPSPPNPVNVIWWQRTLVKPGIRRNVPIVEYMLNDARLRFSSYGQNRFLACVEVA